MINGNTSHCSFSSSLPCSLYLSAIPFFFILLSALLPLSPSTSLYIFFFFFKPNTSFKRESLFERFPRQQCASCLCSLIPSLPLLQDHRGCCIQRQSETESPDRLSLNGGHWVCVRREDGSINYQIISPLFPFIHVWNSVLIHNGLSLFPFVNQLSLCCSQPFEKGQSHA